MPCPLSPLQIHPIHSLTVGKTVGEHFDHMSVTYCGNVSRRLRVRECILLSYKNDTQFLYKVALNYN